MKPYSQVHELLRAVLRVAMPRAGRLYPSGEMKKFPRASANSNS